MANNEMSLFCTVCRHEWAEPQALPMEVSVWVKKTMSIKCPNCGAGTKDLRIPAKPAPSAA